MKQKLFGRLATVAAVLLLSAASASAHDFEVDGIYYNKNSDGTSVSVTYKGSSSDAYANEYSGAVTIPASVTYSGKTYSVTSIGSYAFRGCSGLTSLEIPNSVTKIYFYVFYGCSGLTSVSIGNSVTTIGEDAFSGCSGLKKVDISDLEAWCKISFSNAEANPTYYSHNLFLNGQEIKNLIIPETVRELKSYAFYGCSGLTSVSIGNSVTSIGDAAFNGCSGLTSVSIGNSVTSIGSSAFYNCSGLKKVEISDLEAWCKISFSNVTANPTDYSHNLFLNGQEIKNLIIPETVQELKSYAFYGCSGLTSVEIPNSVTSIDKDAFRGCSGLKKVEISDLEAWCKISFSNVYANPIHYSHNLFLNGHEIKNLIIPETVQELKFAAFYGCRGLTSVEIPNSVPYIGSYTFYGCRGLTSVEIPNSVTSIGGSAFEDCSGLTSVSIGNSVTYIGGYAFDGCSGLTSVSIGNSVTYIGGYAFRGCSGLTSVEIPNSVTSIGNYAFRGCSGMESVEIPNSVTNIGIQAFANCRGLKSITVKSGNTVYDSRDNCNAIIETATNCLICGCKNTIIPNSVTSIGEGAFCYCSGLTSVVIPNSVTKIGNFAFEGCSGLTSVTSLNIIPPTLGYRVFYGVPAYCVLYVPEGCVGAYQSAVDWKNFGTILEIQPGGVEGISKAETAKVRGENGVIRVEGAEGARVEVFNTAGVCIYSGTATEITVLQRGLYVVKVAGRATKLAL